MNKNKYSIFFMKLLLLIFFAITFTITWYYFYSQAIPFPFFRRGNWLIVFLYAFLFYILGKQMNAFNVGKNSVGDLIYSLIITLLILNVFTYFEISLIGRYWLDILGLGLMTLVQIILVVIWSIVTKRIHIRIFPPQNILFLHEGEINETLINEITKHSNKFIIKEYLEINSDPKVLNEKLQQYEAVILCGTDTSKQNEILKICYRFNTRLHILPTVADIIVNGADQINILDAPILICRNTGLTASQVIVKRLTDIIGSLLCCVIAVPVLLIVALMIKIDDGGPVFYSQTRSTLNGKEFKLYKLRTMRVDAEADGVARLSSKQDSRVTKIGRTLRKLRLDEIPQLLNILKGDLTFVGPRPERPELIEEYKKTIPEFDFRLKVKAGLTGYAQVMGKYSTTPQDKLLLDLIYIENYSFMLDIKIALLTVKTIFTPSSTD